MERVAFKKKRIAGRKQLLEKIITAFKTFHPYAVHQFGSGAHGYKDELSDIDVWITFKDSEISDVLKNLNKILKSIAPIVIKHHSKSWSPVGGSANSVIYDTEFGLFVVDLYISLLSETVIKKNFKLVFGNDSLKRGELRLNKEINKNIHDSHTLRSDINLLLALLFIGVKGIVRKDKSDGFVQTVRLVHKNIREKYDKKLKLRRISQNFKTVYKLLSDLYRISNKTQKRAIYKIRKYTKEIETLYQ